MISTNKAAMIASYWHEGQWSGLYQFASSKTFIKENFTRYIAEINRCENVKELRELKEYFTAMQLKEVINAVCDLGFSGVKATEEISIFQLEIGYNTHIATIDNNDCTVNGMPYSQWYEESAKEFLTKTI